MSHQSHWENFQTIDFQKISEARSQLHQAIQVVAMVARSLYPKVSDDHYANLGWSQAYQAFTGRCILDNRFSVALRPGDFTLLIFDNGGIRCEFPMNGKTQDQAFDFLKAELGKLGADVSKFNTELPYEIPAHPTGKGEPFSFKYPEAFEEIRKYFSDADFVLKEVRHEEEGASEVRSWPHHFDFATLIITEEHEDPEKAKSVGVGLSPGDEHMTEPYFYVTPWPYPEAELVKKHELPAGQWQTEGWVGATLSGSEILKAENQKEITESFIHVAMEASKRLLI